MSQIKFVTTESQIKRDDPFFWKDALIDMITNGVSVYNADWTEWCIQISYRWTQIPEEQWPANDHNLNWEPLFGPDRNTNPTRQLRSIISGISLAMDELGLDTSFFPATRYMVESIPDNWETFRSIVTTTCNDIVVSWLSSIVTSWMVSANHICMTTNQDIRCIASALLLAEPNPDNSISFSERIENFVHLDYTMVAVSHVCAVYELYTYNFRIGETVNLNTTGYMDTLYAHSWMPVADIERSLRLAVLVRKLCSIKIQRVWRRYKIKTLLRSTNFLLLLKLGNTNLLERMGHHLLTHIYERVVNPYVLHR